MTAPDVVNVNESSCSSGNTLSRQVNKSRDRSTWRRGDTIQTAFGAFRFDGLGNASAPASITPSASVTSGADTHAAAPAAAVDTLNKLPHQGELDTSTTGTLRSKQQQQQRSAAIQSMLRTSWSSAAVVVDQVECHYRAVQQQLLQQQNQQAEILGGNPQPVRAGSWSGQAARAAELLLCSLFAIIIFIVLGVVTVYAVLARGLQLLVLAVVTGTSVGLQKLRTRLRQRRAVASELGASETAVQPPLAESDNSSSDDSGSRPCMALTPSSHSGSSRSRPDTLDILLEPQSAAASKIRHHQHHQQQQQQQPGTVGAIMSAIGKHGRPQSLCKGDSPSELQLRELPTSYQQQASVASDTGASAALPEADISAAGQPDAVTASQELAPPAAQAPATGLASYASAAQQHGASIVQSVHDTAEAAALVVSAYLVRAAYTISWFLLRRWQLLVAHVTQYGYTHGLVLAEDLCCKSLWLIGCLAADSSHGHPPQLSSLQTQLIRVVKTGSVTAVKAGQWGLATGEAFVSKLTSELLRDASPVTQTAVWGLAGMVRRNVVETCGLCWQLLVALSQVYMVQQQQLVTQ